MVLDTIKKEVAENIRQLSMLASFGAHDSGLTEHGKGQLAAWEQINVLLEQCETQEKKWDEERREETRLRHPMYPYLSEEGAKQAEAVIEAAKRELKRACEEALGEIYTDIPGYVQSDAWTNFRNDLLDGFCGYRNAKVHDYDFRQIRQQILNEHRAELIADLNQDLLKQIESLEATVKHLNEMLDRRY